MHMIGNAHIDPVWLWNWQEGFQEIKATFRSALDRLHESPDFRFVASSAAFYEFIEQNDPAMFREIQQRVGEGRWEIVGGWWIEPDCNLPCGESFVRQGLYGQQYFLEKFGKTATVGFCPDSFGHAASLPQILLQQGLTRYCFLRPKPEEKELPARLFWWQWQDHRVLTFRIPNEYCTQPGADLRPHLEKCEGMCFYGVGNHGGGPTRKDIEWIRSQPDLQFSTPSQYFAGVSTADIPTVSHELQHHARGCYSVHSGVKRWNRRAENLLVTAEKFSTLSDLPYPDFKPAWKAVLFNQFHDILAGTSLESCYDDARDLYGEALASGARALNHAVQRLAWQIHIEPEEDTLPIVVFNPHAFPGTFPVELEWRGVKEEEDLRDDQDRSVPFQLVRSEATVAKGRSRIAFLAELPPLGYRVYRMKPASRPAHRFDSSSWSAPRPVARVYDDTTDTWSHDLKRYDRLVGEFVFQQEQLVEDGPVRQTRRLLGRFGQSTLTLDEIRFSGQPSTLLRVRVDWREQWKVLKLEFPVAASNSRWEVPFGFIERPNDGEEQPMQSWVESGGLAVINDGKHGASCTPDAIQLTVLRSPVYAHHDPCQPDRQHPENYRFIDQGEQFFQLLLAPAGDSPRLSCVFNAPAIALRDTFHPGPRALCHSFGNVENALLGALKKAEQSDAMIARIYNPTADPVQARVQIGGHDHEVALKPFEVLSLELGQGPVNLLEQRQDTF